MMASKPRLVRLQLVETKNIWEGRAAAVTAALQVSEDVTTFLEKLILRICLVDHQSDGDTRPILNYPVEYQVKSLQV